MATKKLSMRGRTISGPAKGGAKVRSRRSTPNGKETWRNAANSGKERLARGPVALTQPPRGYEAWLSKLKESIRTARQRATLAVNRELVALYWRIGHDILVRQGREGWGARVVERLALDLRKAFPDIKGFSLRNLKYMRSFAAAWPDPEFVQQAAAQLPWFHLCTLLDKLSSREQRDWYLAQAVEHGWSRAILVMQIGSNAIARDGRAITNFPARLPPPQSALALESVKDPYRFDFLGVNEEAEERDIENALMRHITRFLLELGAGFAFVGRQFHLEVGGEDFYLDLLFYHLKLRAYVVVELKSAEFRPEHTGKLSFYLSAVDSLVKAEQDNPTIGLLLCKTRNSVIAEYALRATNKPIGVAEYQLGRTLPTRLKTNLPSIEQLERELDSQRRISD